MAVAQAKIQPAGGHQSLQHAGGVTSGLNALAYPLIRTCGQRLAVLRSLRIQLRVINRFAAGAGEQGADGFWRDFVAERVDAGICE